MNFICFTSINNLKQTKKGVRIQRTTYALPSSRIVQSGGNVNENEGVLALWLLPWEINRSGKERSLHTEFKQ